MADVTVVWRVVQAWLDRVQFPPTQSKIAQAVGVQRSAVSDWKWGKTRPTPAHLRRLGQLMAPTVGPKVYELLVIALLVDLGYEPPSDDERALRDYLNLRSDFAWAEVAATARMLGEPEGPDEASGEPRLAGGESEEILAAAREAAEDAGLGPKGNGEVDDSTDKRA